MIENHQDKGFMAALKIDPIIEVIRNNFQLVLPFPYTKATGNLGRIFQGDYMERVIAEERLNGIELPEEEEGVNRILRPAPLFKHD